MAFRMRSLSKSRKAQFFVLSAFAIVSILLFVSRWIEPLTITDTSAAVLSEEQFIFNNIREKAVETVKMSKNCQDLEFNLDEYKSFVEEFAVQKNLRLNFKHDVKEPCDNNIMETRFNISLESNSVFVYANFTSGK